MLLSTSFCPIFSLFLLLNSSPLGDALAATPESPLASSSPAIMLQPSSALLFVTSLLAALPVNADGLYTKKSPVLQVNQKNYDQLIANSNHTSVSPAAQSIINGLQTSLTKLS